MTRYNDNLDAVCVRFMNWLRRDYRGNKSEIGSSDLVKRVKKFSRYIKITDAVLMDALSRRNWFEAQGSDSYLIKYEKMMI